MAVEKHETVIDLDKGKDEEESKKVATNGSTPQGDELDIEIEDDTPLEDRGRQPRKPGTKSSIPDDEEIGQYTKGVQDRLKQMKWEYHEERRAKEAWERQSSAAVEYAKKVHSENARLRKMLAEGHKTLRESTKASGENEIKALQRSLKAALDSGDTDAAADLNAKIASAAARVEAQNHIAPVEFPEEEEAEKGNKPQQQQRQEVRVSRAMQSWMDDNPWFNDNKRMTAFAFGVHEELISNGIPVESPRYFKEIDKAMKDTFPQYFDTDGEEDEDSGDRTNRRSAGNGSQNGATRRRTPVAGVQRNAVSKGNKVTLTSSELAVAKRMGITPEAYAREKQRLENLDG